jgi:hypothetical protein
VKHSFSPLDNLFALPETTRGALDVVQNQHDGSLCALVWGVDIITLDHDGIDVN